MVARRCMAPSKREPCKYKLMSSLTIGLGRNILPSQLERTWLAHAETYSIVFLSSSFCLSESVSKFSESDFQRALKDGMEFFSKVVASGHVTCPQHRSGRLDWDRIM
jgi:hypothetical protein